MTTPNQPAPTWMELLGLGAFQIGGSGGGSGLSKYGQGIDESFVNDLIYGPLAPSNLAANSGAVSDLIPVMQQMIAGVPLPVLKYLQPFIPGATDADFADSATAAAFIVSTFIPKMIIDTTNWLGRFFKDVEILFDVFHITYPVGTSTDPAGQTSWYAAWNDVLELIGLYSGTTPTTTAPTIGPAITVAGIAGANGSSWSTRLTNDLLILFDVFHLTYTSTQWNNAWTDLLALFGVVNSTTTPTNPAPTIGTAITGAQGTANTAASWGARLTNDLIVTSDVFHLVYHTGTPTDAPGLIYTGGGLGNGKMTWYGAWNDLLALCGVVNSVTAPTDAAPTVANVIVANADAVNQSITGATVTGANAAAVQTAVAGLQQTVAGLQDQVGALQAPAASPTTILTDDGRSSPGTGLGSNWTGTGATTAVNRDATSGFTWPASGSVTRTLIGIYNAATLATNDQVGQIVLNTMMSVDPFNVNPENAGVPYNQIILRANAAISPSSYVFARIRSNHVQFGYCASGTEHLLGSPTVLAVGSAANFTFYAGDSTSDYHYSLKYNGRTVASYDDSGSTLSSASIAGRYTGQSWTSDTYSYGGEARPAYTSWRSWDASASAGTPACYGHITRTTYSNVTMTSGFLPYTYFDTQISIGTGITQTTSGNAGFTVTAAGLYAVSYALEMSSTSNATDLYPGIAVNGSLVEVGPTWMYDGGGTLLQGGSFGMASAGILLSAGDTVCPWQGIQSGVNTGTRLLGSGGTTWTGDTAGVRAYMKIAKIG